MKLSKDTLKTFGGEYERDSMSILKHSRCRMRELGLPCKTRHIDLHSLCEGCVRTIIISWCTAWHAQQHSIVVRIEYSDVCKVDNLVFCQDFGCSFKWVS